MKTIIIIINPNRLSSLQLLWMIERGHFSLKKEKKRNISAVRITVELSRETRSHQKWLVFILTTQHDTVTS